jgi:type II secretory pathway component PulF
LQEDEAAPRTHALVGRLRQAIASGKSFAEALALEAAIFPPIYVGMVKAAEMSGALTEVLGQIADARESEQRLKGKILSALLYPTLLVCTAIGVVVFLLAFVVPAFKDALGEQSAQLSVATAAVLAASDWLVAYGDWMLIAIAVLLAACLLLGRLPSVRSFWGRVSLRIPLAGPLLRMAITVRFCRTFGALLSSGLGVAPALTLTRDVIGNEEAKALLDRLGAAIRDGVDFTEPLKTSHVFPPLVASLLRVGDQGGALADVSVRLANMYETKLELGLQRAMSILEPAVILLVSILIGTIVLSIVNSLLGIYDLAGP